MSQPPDDDPNEPRIMTHIDGEEVRLLVHIEPIEEPGDGASAPCAPDEGEPPISPGLAE